MCLAEHRVPQKGLDSLRTDLATLGWRGTRLLGPLVAANMVPREAPPCFPENMWRWTASRSPAALAQERQAVIGLALRSVVGVPRSCCVPFS